MVNSDLEAEALLRSFQEGTLVPNYDLNRLGDAEFERMCQSLLKEVIGSGTVTFGEGRDGGREATFHGTAPYPSETENWTGDWIFQVKYHDVTRIGPDNARQQIIQDLKSELTKITGKYNLHCDNYILLTNVPLSSVHRRGTHDRIANEVSPGFASQIRNIHVWGYDDICRLLEKYSRVRSSYLQYLTTGDLIAELMNYSLGKQSNQIARILRNFLITSFNREQYAQLDQAGEIGEERMPLQKLFIDLPVRPRNREDWAKLLRNESEPTNVVRGQESGFSALQLLLSEKLPRSVLIGGPGEGKSTLGQYLAQIHRATLVNRLSEIKDESNIFVPTLARIPFRVILKDYAQWLTEAEDDSDSIEHYIAYQVKKISSNIVNTNDIQDIIGNNPCLIIFDGLDEVMERNSRSRMLDCISEFIDRCKFTLDADLQILATSRPIGYSDQFDPSQFVHLHVLRLESEKVKEYVNKWVRAKQLDDSKTQRLVGGIDECLADSQVQLLMNTPLQVTILILIVLSGGTPPRQREALFNEYLEVIYKRETAKAKTIIQTEKQLLFELHEYLGYMLHSRANEAQDIQSGLNEVEFIKEVRTFLRYNDPFSPSEELDERVALIVREARERLVLIVVDNNGYFGFELRSLQEFFAAAHLTRARDSKQRFDRFEAIARSLHWRNVALFFSGRVGRLNSGEAANILEVCKEIDRNLPDTHLHRGEGLALEIAVDPYCMTHIRSDYHNSTQAASQERRKPGKRF